MSPRHSQSAYLSQYSIGALNNMLSDAKRKGRTAQAKALKKAIAAKAKSNPHVTSRGPVSKAEFNNFVSAVSHRTAGSGLRYEFDRFARVDKYDVYRSGKSQPIGRILHYTGDTILVSIASKGLKLKDVHAAGLKSELKYNPSVSEAASYLLKLDLVSRGRSLAPNPRRRSRRNGSKKYSLKSAREVARRLRLSSVKRIAKIAKRIRRNCGCGKRKK